MLKSFAIDLHKLMPHWNKKSDVKYIAYVTWERLPSNRACPFSCLLRINFSPHWNKKSDVKYIAYVTWERLELSTH